MIQESEKVLISELSPRLLAMHSSSETLGVATLDCRNPDRSRKSATFSIGRELSNNLFSCVEEVLPASTWKEIGGLAVAIGPGGFTSTRLTVVMARTLSQQLGCSLYGVSSFALMASRLWTSLSPEQLDKPFWIFQPLHRRGIVAGFYQINNSNIAYLSKEVIEIKPPHLIHNERDLKPAILAKNDIKEDVNTLLNISLRANELGQFGSWEDVLPIYPTSPVDNI